MGPNSTKTEAKERIARETAEYLARGGEIDHVGPDEMKKEVGDIGDWRAQAKSGTGFSVAKSTRKSRAQIISEQYGKPFWEVVKDLSQGRLNRRVVARKLGIPVGTFSEMVRRAGQERLFGRDKV